MASDAGSAAATDALVVRTATGADPVPALSYNHDVRPILAAACFSCHGPDKARRKAGLALHDPDSAMRTLASGHRAVVPFDLDASELFQRITSQDPDERMPPAASRVSLTAAQVQTLAHWISTGAIYEPHWSYQPVARPPLPTVVRSAWVRTPVDAFVLARLEREHLTPSPEAPRPVLLRRLSLDLTGLPPTPAEVDAFVADQAPDAYERQVARLLASPRYGERMAVFWLDLVRYADSIGFHSDVPRNVAPYRTWVIAAFNANMPFDEFTREQIAGDLLPETGVAGRVASAYNRLTMTTEEVGAQPKEYEVRSAADRVRNLSSVWLGSTMACAECHDHKYDPFSQRDFYNLAAFFADVQEPAIGPREPGMLLPTEAQAAQLRDLAARRATMQRAAAARSACLDRARAAWEQAQAAGPAGPPRLGPVVAHARYLPWELTRAAPPELFRTLSTFPPDIAWHLTQDPAGRTPAQADRVYRYWWSIAPETAAVRAQLAAVTTASARCEASIPRCLVTTSGPTRTVRLRPRGNWMDESGPVCDPQVPHFLAQLDTRRRPSRRELADWLVAPENPLVARVLVNRLWQVCFGQGIVRTPGDFGLQGEAPTHPELLDFLASDLVAHGWDIQQVLREIVCSSTYRQDSQAGALADSDPENRLLARQSRFRLDAEFIRDNALAVSGLLVERIGGPSAYPYQPSHYWMHLNFPPRTWVADRGDDQYRRGVYTWWQRTFLHPSLLTFDAPVREECTAQRPRSNTPQQALDLLNDPTYVEASRAFAERILHAPLASDAERVGWAMRLALARTATPEEGRILLQLLASARQAYRTAPAEATALLRIGNHVADAQLDPVTLAAWTQVTRTILNLHETITRD